MLKELKIFGRTLKLHLRNEGDYAVANELFLDKQYGQCENVIKKAKNCIIDVGGHLGFFSLMASALNPTVPIFTFEPHSGNYEILKQNLKENRIKSVHPKQLAVNDSIEQIDLQLSQEDLNHSIIKAIEPTGESQKVQTTTLERIFQKNRIERCDLLKLDCEGSEYDIIYSAPDDLLKKIQTIFLEYHEWDQKGASDKLKNYLIAKGYKVQKFPNSKMPELGYLWCH